MPTNLKALEDRLWDAADQLRANSHLKSSEYSAPVLGLIFLRYADVKFAHAEVSCDICRWLPAPDTRSASAEAGQWGEE